jgi:hypothetical protein
MSRGLTDGPRLSSATKLWRADLARSEMVHTTLPPSAQYLLIASMIAGWSTPAAATPLKRGAVFSKNSRVDSTLTSAVFEGRRYELYSDGSFSEVEK